MGNLKENKSLVTSLKVGVIYLVFGLIWIFFSDRFLETFSFSIETLSIMQTYKGFFFILLSASIISFLIYNGDRKLRVILSNYRDIFNSNYDSIIILGYLDFEIIEVNKTFLEVFKFVSGNSNSIDLLDIVNEKEGFGINRLKQELASVRNVDEIRFNWIFKDSEGTKIDSIVTAKISKYKKRDVIYLLIEDVSKLNALEKRLNKDLNNLEKAAEEISEGVFIIEKKGLDYKPLFQNAEVEKLFGSNLLDSLRNRSIIIYNLNSAEMEFNELPFIKVLDGNKKIISDEFIVKKGTEEFPVLIKSIPILNNEKKITSVITIFKDYTESRKFEQLSKQWEARYRTLVETSTEAILIYNADTGRIMDFNKKALYLFKMKADELLKFHPAEMSPEHQPNGESSFEKSEKYIHAALRGGTPHFDWTHQNKYGENIPCEVSLARMPAPKGNFVRCTIVDVSDRNLAEEMLNKTEKIYQEVIAATTDNITIHDASTGELLEANNTFLKTFGFSLDELKDLSICEIYSSSEDYTKEQFEEIFKNVLINKEMQFKWKSFGKNDKVIWLEMNLKYIDIGGEGRVIAISNNINEILVAEQELIKLTSSLEEKNNEFRHILYTTTHDLRTPLLNILGFSNELLENHSALVKMIQNKQEIDIDDFKDLVTIDCQEDINIIVENTKKMSILINGLLEISKIGTFEIKNEEINVALLLREISKDIEHKLQSGNVKLEVDTLPVCYCDRHKLHQIFTNLIDNSIKFRSDNTEAKINITGKIVNNKIRYVVSDNGIGIEEKNLTKVTKMFYRNDPDLARGAGLGLTIVEKALEEINGTLTIKSKLGEGTDCIIDIPNLIKD